MEEYRYHAFISYSWKDKKYARWLQQALESYRFPKGFLKKHPEIPKRLHIFRDDTDLYTSKGLYDALYAMLDVSKYLIIICSPNSARSEAVCKEVEYFKSIGRQDRIIPIILSGEPFSENAPENECFPLPIRNKERQHLGIRVKKLRWSSSLIRVIKTMFSLRPRELRPWEISRIASLTFLCGFLIAVEFGLIWHYTPHSKYYNTYTTVNEIPVGICELSRDERKQAYDCYKITTKQNKVISVERVNSKGYVFESLTTDVFDDYPRLIYKDHDSLNRPKTIEAYDAENRFVLQKNIDYGFDENMGEPYSVIQYETSSLLSSQGLSSNMNSPVNDSDKASTYSDITRVINTYDDNGLIKTSTYQNNNRDFVCDGNGIYGKAYTYNDFGLITSITNLDADGNAHSGRSGWSKQVLEYSIGENGELNFKGVPEISTFYSANGTPTACEDGYVSRLCTTTLAGNIWSYSYYLDEDRKIPTKHIDGMESITYTYTSGELESISFFNGSFLDGSISRAIDTDGISIIHFEYDSYGREKARFFFGADNKSLSPDLHGFSCNKYERDKNGRLTVRWFCDAEGNLAVEKNSGASGISYDYYDNGKVKTVCYLGKDGKPKNNLFGYCSENYIYDDYKKRSQICTLLDADGNAATHTEGYSIIEYSYDAVGNIKETLYYNSDGELSECKYGMAKIEFTYNNGQIETEAYFDKEGEPAKSILGFHKVIVEYDSVGNKLRESFKDEEGRLTVNTEPGAAVVEYIRDIDSTPIKSVLYDADGSFKSGKVMYHCFTNTPNEEYGIQPNDIIIKFNSYYLFDENLENTYPSLLGKEFYSQTKKNITVCRINDDGTYAFIDAVIFHNDFYCGIAADYFDLSEINAMKEAFELYSA